MYFGLLPEFSDFLIDFLFGVFFLAMIIVLPSSSIFSFFELSLMLFAKFFQLFELFNESVDFVVFVADYVCDFIGFWSEGVSN